jgi:hypothetical protein
MKAKNTIKTIAASTFICMSLSSCSDWLDVKMEDKIMENTLYSEYKGYLTALNGVYLGMNDVYSTTLSAGVLDVMAQYYYVRENDNHRYKIYSGYKYSDSSFESTNYTVWSTLYNLLANVNVILEHTEDGVLTEKQHAIIKGEALALRAFFHFDLLRLYGPIFSENSTATSIPYQDSSSREIQPMLPANEVLDKIIADLEASAALLKQYDPVITEGVGNTATSDNGLSNYDYSFRQLRLNYYAVETLLARAYLWGGNKAKAYQIAKNEVIDKANTEALEVFPWVTNAEIEASGKPDLIFSSEVMFSLYNTSRYESVYGSLFSPTLTTTSRLTFYGTGLTGDSKVGTFYDDENDYRKRAWAAVVESSTDENEDGEETIVHTSSVYFTKYNQFSSEAEIDGTETYRYMIPLIRMSEAYLIAAETATDKSEAIGYINLIRDHRACVSIGEDADLDDALTKEFAREMIGEGQLFYFYKRRAAESLITGFSASGTYAMSLSNYVWPIPEEEINKRVLVSGK